MHDTAQVDTWSQAVPVESRLEGGDATFSLASINGEAEPRVLHAGHRHGDHLEVLHVVARRGLVALVAVGRERGWVAELGDGPAALGEARGVARGAVGPEERAVRVLVRVAGVAVEGGFLGPDARVGDGEGCEG